MNYFGGLGAGKGWHTVMLLPTTALLSELLTSSGLRLFVSDKRVPADYKSTTVTEYLVGFQCYLDLVSRGEQPDWQSVGRLSIGLTHSDTTFSEEECKDTRFKLLYPSEPVITVRPCNICCNSNSFRIGIGAQPEATFGLGMNYPKVFSTAQERHGLLHPTDGLPNSQLWLRLLNQIKISTRPLVVTNEDCEIRTRMRISHGAIPAANAHHLLQRFGFKVKATNWRRPSVT